MKIYPIYFLLFLLLVGGTSCDIGKDEPYPNFHGITLHIQIADTAGHDLIDSLRTIGRETTQAELQVVLEKNFHFLLVAWGISAEKLPDAIRDLRLRLLVFCLPIAMAIILAYQAITGGILFLFAALLCFLVGLVGLLTTSWRLYVLKRRQFLPFRCWLVSFFRQ